jgi:hypothetical protein
LKLFYLQTQGFGIDEFNQIELISNMAVMDTMIVVWKEKRRWDAVRPFTAIRYLYGDQVSRDLTNSNLYRVYFKTRLKYVYLVITRE